MDFSQLSDRLMKMFRSKTFYILVGVSLIILIISIVSVTVLWRRKRARFPNLLKQKHRASETLTIHADSMPSINDPFIFTIHLRFYIQDWRYRYKKFKCLIQKGEGKTVCPQIEFDKEATGLNTAHFTLNTQEGLEYITLDDIELRKWVTLTFVVNQKHIDCYHNGKLQKTHTLKGLPKINGDDVIVCPSGGFMGMVDAIIYSPYSLSPEEVLYLEKRPFPNVKKFLASN